MWHDYLEFELIELLLFNEWMEPERQISHDKCTFFLVGSFVKNVFFKMKPFSFFCNNEPLFYYFLDGWSPQKYTRGEDFVSLSSCVSYRHDLFKNYANYYVDGAYLYNINLVSCFHLKFSRMVCVNFSKKWKL